MVIEVAVLYSCCTITVVLKGGTHKQSIFCLPKVILNKKANPPNI